MPKRKLLEFAQPTVPVPLSTAEVEVKARELATMCGDIDKLRADAAEYASTERKKIRALEKQRRVLAECVRTGTQQVPAQLELGGDGKGRAKSRTV